MHDEIRRSNPIATVFFTCVALAMLAMLCRVAVDAVVESEGIQRTHYSAPITATYEYPAAYLLQTPTPEQMSHLEHLRTVAKVGQ